MFSASFVCMHVLSPPTNDGGGPREAGTEARQRQRLPILDLAIIYSFSQRKRNRCCTCVAIVREIAHNLHNALTINLATLK